MYRLMILKGKTPEKIEAILQDYLWGSYCELWQLFRKPIQIDRKQGDGLQICLYSPYRYRPQNFLILVDSGIDLDDVNSFDYDSFIQEIDEWIDSQLGEWSSDF